MIEIEYGKNCIKRIKPLVMALVLMLCLCACGKKQVTGDNVISVYYVNSSETGIVSNDYELKSPKSNTDDAISELIEVLKTVPEKMQYGAPLSEGIDVIGYSLQDKLLTLNFSINYQNIGRTTEILDRAAIVRTFTQLEEVEYVTFMVEGKPLTDQYGKVIGNMSSDTFIYNAGNEINTYEKVELKLYFANEDGSRLMPVYRSVVYSSNISMEKLMVEQIIKGPNTDIVFPTVSKDAKIKSTNIKDGVCYIDFESFSASQTNKVTSEVAIYSIVNTLTELPNINKVVFSVNGETPFPFMDSIINGAYERNLDLLVK